MQARERGALRARPGILRDRKRGGGSKPRIPAHALPAGSHPGETQAGDSLLPRSPVTPVSSQLGEQLGQRRYQRNGRRCPVDRHCSWSHPPSAHCLSEHRVRKNRAAGLPRRTKFDEQPVTMFNPYGLARCGQPHIVTEPALKHSDSDRAYTSAESNMLLSSQTVSSWSRRPALLTHWPRNAHSKTS